MKNTPSQVLNVYSDLGGVIMSVNILERSLSSSYLQLKKKKSRVQEREMSSSLLGFLGDKLRGCSRSNKVKMVIAYILQPSFLLPITHYTCWFPHPGLKTAGE